MSNLMLLKGGIAARVFAAATTLNDAAVFYNLEESTGATRNDATSNAQNLTDNNSVAQVSGKINNGASFTRASSMYLSRASSATTQTGDIDVTWAGWVKFPTVNASGNIYGMIQKGSGGAFEYYMGARPDNGQWFFRCHNIVDGAQLNLNAFSFAADTWYQFRFEHDSVNNTMTIDINNGAATASQAYSAGMNAGSDPFELGRIVYFQTSYLNGVMDLTGMWKRVWTTQEKSDFYNSGNGLNPFA